MNCKLRCKLLLRFLLRQLLKYRTSEFCGYFQVWSKVAVATKISIASIQYNERHFVVSDEDISAMPQFGKIHSLVSSANSNAWYMVVEHWTTTEFCKHVHAFSVSKSTPVNFVPVLLQVSSLLDHHCHTVIVQNGLGKDYIRLPYHVFKQWSGACLCLYIVNVNY